MPSSSKYCVYCGNPLKSSDKFCIICGKPVLGDLSKSSKEKIEPKEKPKMQPKKKVTVQDILEEEEIESDVIEEEIEDEEPSKNKKEKKRKKGKKGREEDSVEKPLPFEVKEQMILYIDYNDIQVNKQVLAEKLKEIQKSLKDPRYDVDEEFKNSVNIKVNAIKTLIDEYKEKEAEIDKKRTKPFIVQRIANDIEAKIFQLKNLSREYKLHKIDQDTFETLREKYKAEKADLEKEKEDLTTGMKLWIKELKMEKAELESERNLNKGRYSAKEISEDLFNKKDKEFEVKLKKIDSKITTLIDLTK
jgi:hypothetical protein